MSRLALPDALKQLAQAQGTVTPPYSPPSWDFYGGGEATLLTIVLLAVPCGFVCAGKRLHMPVGIARPGSTVAWLLIAIWLLAVCILGATWSVYGLQLKEAYPSFVEPRVRVHIFTIIDAVVTFFVILYVTRRWGWKVYAAQRRHRHCRCVDDLRVSVRPDCDDAKQSPDPEPYDGVSADLFPTVISGRVLYGIATDVAAIDASDRICGLLDGRDVCGIRRLGCLRVCVSYGAVTARTQCYFENPMLRRSDYAVCLEGGGEISESTV
jgi:hypothetical protein